MDKRLQVWIWAGILIGLLAGGAIAAITAQNNTHVSDGVTLESPQGLEVKVWTETNITAENIFQGTNEREVVINSSDGNITLASSGNAHTEIYPTQNITGTWTNVSNITAGSTWVEVYPTDKQRFDVRGDTDKIAMQDIQLDDGNTDFYIDGPNGGTGTVKFYTLPANEEIAAVDTDGTFLASATTDSNGNATFNIPLSSHTVELKTVDSDAPVISKPDPTGQVSDSPNEVSVRVEDQDFAENTDEVQVTFWLKGSQIAQKKITSNGTVTASVSQNFDLGETVKWNVSAIDSYGLQATSNNSFQMPANVTLRNESNASQVIKNKNITATFYSANGEIVVQKSDSDGDGNISLAGLPDTSFVVTFEGSGWYDRRAYIDSIGDQSNIYLLNSTAYPTGQDEAIQTTFVYEDRTGEYPQENTTLIVQRAVDVNNDSNYSWAMVAGDYWGAAGEFPFTGQYQTRYRLRIVNQETGESRTLGTHIPVADGTKGIIVGRIIFEAENATGRFWDAGINQNTSNLQILYTDPTNTTTDLRITVHEQGNASNEIYNSTFSGPLGTKIVVLNLNQNQTDTNWIVEFDAADSNDGPVFGQLIVGGGQYLIPVAQDILTSFIFVFVTFVMALYGPRTAVLGAWAGVFVVAGTLFLGWLTINPVALTVMVLVAVGATFYSEAMPS